MKKVFALVIVVVLLAAMAAPMALADNVTVTLSVSVNGELVLAAEPITTGDATVEGVLKEAHKAFYSDGEAGFVAGIDSTYNMYMISQVWGVATTPYVILNTAPLGSGANAAYTTADTAPVNAGDNIIVVADSKGMTPAASMEYDAETNIIKLNQWALDFTTFKYSNAAIEEAEIIDAQTGEVIGTTNALGNTQLTKKPSCGVAMYKGVAAVPVGDVQVFECVKDAYVPPAHDYSVFGGEDGKSLLLIVIFGVGAVIPLLVIVVIAQNKEIKSGGVKYADLRGDKEITRHM